MSQLLRAGAVLLIAAVAGGLTIGTPIDVTAQAPACLHGTDETPADLARRRDAVAFTRALVTEQRRTFSADKSYRRLADLQNLPGMPAGFAAQLAVEREVFALGLKDTLDPCGYALFVDQNGLIYVGRPMQ